MPRVIVETLDGSFVAEGYCKYQDDSIVIIIEEGHERIYSLATHSVSRVHYVSK